MWFYFLLLTLTLCIINAKKNAPRFGDPSRATPPNINRYPDDDDPNYYNPDDYSPYGEELNGPPPIYSSDSYDTYSPPQPVSNYYNDKGSEIPIYDTNSPYEAEYDTRRSKQKFADIPTGQTAIVKKYVRTVPSTILVAIFSSIFIYITSNLLLHFIISKAPAYIIFGLAILGLLATFIPGEVGNFSRSSGVFLLLLIQRSTIHIFLPQLIKQLLAACMLTRRKAFPSTEDPWKYKPRKEGDIEFA